MYFPALLEVDWEGNNYICSEWWVMEMQLMLLLVDITSVGGGGAGAGGSILMIIVGYIKGMLNKK